MLADYQCEEFSSRYVKQIVDFVQDDNFMVVLHHCGNTVSLVEREKDVIYLTLDELMLLLNFTFESPKRVRARGKHSVFNKYVKISEEFKKLEMERTWDSIPVPKEQFKKSKK